MDYLQQFSQIATIVSALAALYGLYQFLLYYRDRYVNKKCQRKILLDLFRHLFTNNTHAEAIRYHIIKERDRSDKILTEGIWERFCFIEDDLELRNMNCTRNPTRTLMLVGRRNAVRITMVTRIMSRQTRRPNS